MQLFARRGEPSLTHKLLLTCNALGEMCQTIGETLFSDQRRQERRRYCAAFKPARLECGHANSTNDLLC
jgi:hypothetical protein